MTHIREEMRAKINSSLVQQPVSYLEHLKAQAQKRVSETNFSVVQDIGDDPRNTTVWNCCHKHQSTP